MCTSLLRSPLSPEKLGDKTFKSLTETMTKPYIPVHAQSLEVAAGKSLEELCHDRKLSGGTASFTKLHKVADQGKGGVKVRRG